MNLLKKIAKLLKNSPKSKFIQIKHKQDNINYMISKITLSFLSKTCFNFFLKPNVKKNTSFFSIQNRF
jgi:hypothetical protein